MKVIVVVENSPESAIIDPNSAFFVEQANSKVIVDQHSYCKLVGRSVKALVPACVPTVTNQVSEVSFLKLVACYESCINLAVSAGAQQIYVPPLGVGVKMTRMSDNGEIVFTGLWGNLFWTHTKSSMAAKAAVENIYSITSDDTAIVFGVPIQVYDDWDWVLHF